MFKVRATVIGFDEDEKRHPCHFQYKIGDTVVWDGEKFIGIIFQPFYKNSLGNSRLRQLSYPAFSDGDNGYLRSGEKAGYKH